MTCTNKHYFQSSIVVLEILILVRLMNIRGFGKISRIKKLKKKIVPSYTSKYRTVLASEMAHRTF